MNVFEVGEKTFLKFSNLTETGVFHFTSTKEGWGQNGKSRFTGDHPDIYQSFRNELSVALSLSDDQFIFPRQIHGNNIEIASSSMVSTDIPETDALITNKAGLCICVQTADCVPVLLYDPVQKVAAAIHAGWRGTVNKIVSETIIVMKNRFNTNPKNLLAGIGPSASPAVYEVGQDVITSVKENFANHDKLLLTSTSSDKAYFDLWKANKTLLTESEVSEKNIEVMGFCTLSNEKLFYSARRDGASTGRMITGIMLS